MSNETSQAMIELIDMMGNDLRIVNAARVSYGKNSMEFGEREEKILRSLAVNHHGTPFEHVVMTWRIKAPIFVAREWMRHRIGSYNEISGRYVELPNEQYLPKQFRMPDTSKRQMAYKYKDAPEDLNDEAREILAQAYEASDDAYRKLLELGIANEHARMIMPVGQYTEFYWTVNARAFMNFLSLRTHPTAMKEIRTYAQAMEHIWAQRMPATHRAFVECERVAP